MIEEIIKEVKEKQSEIEILKKELQKKSEEAFFKGTKQIFNSNPKLVSVAWTQYTPYFNDGSECVFDANIDYLEVNGEDSDENDSLSPTIVKNYGNWNRTLGVYEDRVEEPNPNFDKELSEAVDSISEFLRAFNNEFYREQFGDHVKVTITSTGIETEEYEHE